MLSDLDRGHSSPLDLVSHDLYHLVCTRPSDEGKLEFVILACTFIIILYVFIVYMQFYICVLVS